MFWLLLLLWPQPVDAHVQWFVSVPTVQMAHFSAQEWLLGLGLLAGILGMITALTKLDIERWQRLRLPDWVLKWVPVVAWCIAVIFSIMAFHRELILVYVGLCGYALLRKQQPRVALTVLAIGTGLAFSQAALAEKLFHPEYSATFLQTHHWNFLYNFGVTFFTDRWFILQAGIVEGGLGIALALGLAPRIAIAMLSVVCILTGCLLGIGELMGHTPIIMAFVIYLIETTRLPAWSAIKKI